MFNLLKIFIAVIVIHAIYNLINYLRYPRIEKLLLLNYSSDDDDQIKGATYKTTIQNYIKFAGVKDKRIPVVQPLGYSRISCSNVSVIDNLLNPRSDIVSKAVDMLLEAKGNYWSNFINSINPFYWLRWILYLPKNICEFLGIDSNNITVKIIQIIYWFISFAFTFAISVYPEEIKNLISSFIK